MERQRKTKVKTARKPWKCTHCEGHISPGEEYLSTYIPGPYQLADKKEFCNDSCYEKWQIEELKKEHPEFFRSGAYEAAQQAKDRAKREEFKIHHYKQLMHIMNYATGFTTTNQKETNTMYEITTKTFIDGTDVKTLHLDQKIKILTGARDRVKELKSAGLKGSKMVQAEIAKIEKFITEASEVFDAEGGE